MTDDGSAPTIPDTQAPTHGPSLGGIPKAPDARYALRTLLGKGGMGEVWLAHDVRIDREIAIKLMRGGADDPDSVARFLREARVQGRLEHPSVVPVHDLGDEKTPYFAMKRLTGTTLADVLLARDVTKWPRRTLLARFIDVCLAIELAHQRGVIHRDLKPANIMLGDFGETYVLDWGLSRIAGDTDILRDSDRSGDSTAGQTEVGAMLGTPGYMSPEQMRGEVIDSRTDVFALGCILYELLAGAPAIARENAFEQTMSAPSYRPRDRAADVPPELDAICEQATQADKDKRTATARELADAVQRFLDGDRDLERRRVLAAQHAARALELFAGEHHDARAEAMREAGSAIALDAGNADAKAVLARLLLDPPREMPKPVVAAIDEERQVSVRALAVLGARTYFAFAILLPIVYLLGFSKIWPLAIVGGELAAATVFCWFAGHRNWHIGGAALVTLLFIHTAMLATIGLFIGPLLLLPTLVFGTAGIFASLTVANLTTTIIVSHLIAIGVPLALEWLAITPRTYHMLENGLVLQPWAVEMSPNAMVFATLAVITMQLVANGLLFDRQRRIQIRAQEQLHVQKWQLEQLVPSSGARA